MARYTGPSCKLCRREGSKLFLKGERCLTERCAFERRDYPPGQHGQRISRRKQSDYGVQLREKQKAKRIYGVMEEQFRAYFDEAGRRRGISGENLLRILESRLDSIVFRLGMAPSRKCARQLVRHGHIAVNSRSVNIPSYLTKPGDVVGVREKSRQLAMIHDSLRRMDEARLVPWLMIDKGNLLGTVVDVPKREDIPTPIEEQAIVDFYSK